MRRILGVAVASAISATVGCSSEVTKGDDRGDVESTGQTASALVDASFVVTGLARKCIDFGGDAYQAVGAPVYLHACNGTTAQKLRVVELADGSHDVSLRTNRGFCLGVRGGVGVGRAIELQVCNAASAAQRFALDGDTIFVGTQTSGRVARDLVVEVDRGRGVNRTPLVVGVRDLDPAEDFRFGATSFAALLPTSGFKMVTNVPELDRALEAAHWGSVIVVAPNTTLRIDDADYRDLRGGVTLRSDRRGMVDGSEIHRANGQTGVAFRVVGDNVRITGLRLRGPSTSKDGSLPTVAGIQSPDPAYRVLVDHDELSAWTDAGVSVQGGRDAKACYVGNTLAQNTRVIASYIHDNARQNMGYGVASVYGGNPYVDGNTFARNRHAVSADFKGQTSYTAVYNLVTESNDYCWPSRPFCLKEHDFDVHGEGSGDHFEGGQAGYQFTMRWNTFFPDGTNVHIRGTPCKLALVTDNSFFNNTSSDAIELESPVRVTATPNLYREAPPLLVTGDFDGDGTQDDFMGTGAAWFYRPGGTKEWRILNRFNERTERLTFGDFDGDGRTDVRTIDSQGRTQTSWGGSSPWDAPSGAIFVPPSP